MGPANEPLFQAIVIAHHDPHPERAFRYKPFVPEIARTPEVGGTTAASGRQAGGIAIRLDPVGAVRRLWAAWHPAKAPACAPACC